MFNLAKSSEEKANHLKSMTRSRGYQKVFPLKAAQYDYYNDWFNVPIRELVSTTKFKNDPAWIAQHIRNGLTKEEAERSLSTLKSLDFVYEDESGQLKQRHSSMSTDYEVHSSVVRNYQRKMIKLAADSLDEVPMEKRDVSSVCIPVSEKSAQKIKTLVQEFREQVLAVADAETETEQVYQLNIQFFPLSKEGSDEN